MESLPQALDRVYKALSAATRLDEALSGPEPELDAPPGSPAAATEPWTALDQLTALFGLTPFERDVLVLLTGRALQARFARACGAVTFALALAVLDDPHWSALSSARPLRYWQLVSVDPGDLMHAPARLDDPILAHLIGMPAIDERLNPLIHPLRVNDAPGLAAGDADAVQAGVRHWAGRPSTGDPLLLVAAARPTRERAFAAICAALGLLPCAIEASDIPGAPADREQLARLWSREAALHGGALLVRTRDADDLPPHVLSFLSVLDAPAAIEASPGSAAERLDGLRLPLAGLTRPERREHARRGLHGLATPVEPHARWDDLVLPETQVDTLRQIAAHVRHKALVNDEWGFAAKHPRGLGLTILFAGASGTGKTMAAEVIAAELGLDLYRIDLATVVSKYIGETEKNLRMIFSAAADTDAILLFDEADALFGKRSEVRDSHDRYANLEVSYLLQQMEAYRGAAILTTNMPHALDPAFMRRLRFIVQFPFPDAAARARIWRGIFPAATPVGNLDWGQLAQLNVAGGVIRNIATLAAFRAAADGGRVEARHILAAVRTEYTKLDKPLTAAETRGLT
jgi:ATPase family protein associated with various cellular activities (AAA)/winged helix domain-containing protein